MTTTAAPPLSTMEAAGLVRGDDRSASTARIGPNAIFQLLESVREAHGSRAAFHLLGAAGMEGYVYGLPHSMVPEGEVTALYAALQRQYGSAEAAKLSEVAGLRTADYLLAHRIPKLAQRVLETLPPPLASRLLLKAIGHHAWTFSGSARFGWKYGRPLEVWLDGGAWLNSRTARAAARSFYGAVFERLFQKLVARTTTLGEPGPALADGVDDQWHGIPTIAETGHGQCRLQLAWRAPASLR